MIRGVGTGRIGGGLWDIGGQETCSNLTFVENLAATQKLPFLLQSCHLGVRFTILFIYLFFIPNSLNI